METYPVWKPDEIYVTGDYAVHDGQLYQATEPVAGTKPEPTDDGRAPWLWLGRYVPL